VSDDDLDKVPANYDLPKYILNQSIPWDEENKMWSRCRTYVNSSKNLDVEICEEWVYDSPTAVSQFDLVCERSWLRPWAQVVIMCGEFFASVILSAASDSYGRKMVLMGALTGVVLVSFCLVFAVNYYVFLLLRFLLGFFNPCIFMVGLPMSLELVGPKKRTVVTTIGCMFWVAGCLLIAVVAYLIRDWQYLQLATAVPGLLFLTFWKFLPESPRWLLSVGRKDEAMQIIQKMAKVNGVDTVDLEKLLSDEDCATKSKATGNILDLFRYKNIRLRLLLCMIIIFANSFVYYGLSLNSGNLVGGVYLNFFLLSLLEIPATLLCLLVDRIGRKKLVIAPMLIGGIVMAVAVFIPKDWHIIITCLSMAGKFGITLSYTVVYLLICEIFPTRQRNMSLGLTSIGGRLGGIVAPFVEQLGTVWRPGPPLVFGIVSVIGGLLTIPLPESTGKDLPESTEDGENFGSHKPKNFN
jgi:OCT family organic cation transporter-like MFS transporter 4/5